MWEGEWQSLGWTCVAVAMCDCERDVPQVTHVTPHSVDVNYRRIPYDYLVIATGARARSMLKPQCVTKLQRQQSISACSAPSVTPRNVVVIGGGPSAIEYAALAKTANPTATVSLYSDTPSLLPRVKDGGAVHDTVLKRLQEVGVDVHLGRRLIGSGANDGTFTLVKGGK